jgi:hypothetical protein
VRSRFSSRVKHEKRGARFKSRNGMANLPPPRVRNSARLAGRFEAAPEMLRLRIAKSRFSECSDFPLARFFSLGPTDFQTAPASPTDELPYRSERFEMVAEDLQRHEQWH